MKRRAFIAGLGSAAAWPMVARAQTAEHMGRIGVLMDLAADDPEAKARVAALVKGSNDLGWDIGRNVQIDYRWVVGDADRRRLGTRTAARFFARSVQLRGGAERGR
jgi:putative tryptophan/tyrosine transport system substrate-binding protein